MGYHRIAWDRTRPDRGDRALSLFFTDRAISADISIRTFLLVTRDNPSPASHCPRVAFSPAEEGDARSDRSVCPLVGSQSQCPPLLFLLFLLRHHAMPSFSSLCKGWNAGCGSGRCSWSTEQKTVLIQP